MNHNIFFFQIFKKPLIWALFVLITISFTTGLTTVNATGSNGQSIGDLLQNSGVANIQPDYLPIADAEKPKEALANTIQSFTNVISGFAAGVAILFIAVNAAKLVLAVGSSDDITKAKKGLIWAGIGLLIIIFAFVLAKTVIRITFSGDLS